MICRTPTNHVRNLDVALSNNDAIPDTLTTPMHSNMQLERTKSHTLNALSKQFIHQMETNLEFFIYDHSDLKASYQTAVNIINSHTTISKPSTLLPAQQTSPTTSCQRQGPQT